MIESFMKFLKNKYVLGSLFVINIFTFTVGFIFNNTDLMLLAALSFASVLLSIEIRSREHDE